MVRFLLSNKLGELKWTQAKLARKTGIRPSTVNALYHEFAERISFNHIDLICEALGCDASELFVSIPNQKQPKHQSRPRKGK